MQRIQRYVVKSDASQLQNVLEFVDWKEWARRLLAVVVNVIILMDLCYELWSIWTVHFFTLNKGRFSYLKSSPNCNNDNVTLNDVWLFCVECIKCSGWLAGYCVTRIWTLILIQNFKFVIFIDLILQIKLTPDLATHCRVQHCKVSPPPSRCYLWPNEHKREAGGHCVNLATGSGIKEASCEPGYRQWKSLWLVELKPLLLSR